MIESRRTGTDLLPAIPWGTHFCQFYQTPADLLSQVVPYLKAGLESDEACVWITSQPIDPATARESLAAVVPDLDRLEACGQLHIAPYTEWYRKDGVFDRQRVLDAWMALLGAALARGFQGLRVTGNTAWLEKAGWQDFEVYEAADALRMLSEGLAVNVIVSDIGMPGMDGYELLRALRSLGGGAEPTPAIALTAYGRAEDAARALASGYQQHLTKPISAAALIAAVWQVLAPHVSRA